MKRRYRCVQGRAGGGSDEGDSAEMLHRQWHYWEVLKGFKGRLELVLLVANGLLSGAHPAYVLFMTENFTTLERPPS